MATDGEWEFIKKGWKFDKTSQTWLNPAGEAGFRFDPAMGVMVDAAGEKVPTAPSFPGTDEEIRQALAKAREPPPEEEGGGSIALASPDESKVIVEDLGKRFNVFPGFILVFKDKKTGRLSPYFTDLFYGTLMERKGYSRLEVEKTGDKHNPKEHKFHYIAELTPSMPDKALEALRMLKDVDREEFLKEYRRLTAPIREEGYASPDTVRMKTMKTDYNLDRMARRRAHRHMGMLYTGVGGGLPRRFEEEAEGADYVDERPPPKVVKAEVRDVPREAPEPAKS